VASAAGTLRLREFLTRNGHPFVYIDLDTQQDLQTLLDSLDITRADISRGCRSRRLRDHDRVVQHSVPPNYPSAANEGSLSGPKVMIGDRRAVANPHALLLAGGEPRLV
jgi:hypothetical protein